MNEELKTIKELRKMTGLSQTKFADKYHISVQTLRNWEQGVTKTPENYLWAINHIFELEGTFKKGRSFW